MDFSMNPREFERGLRRWIGRTTDEAHAAMERTGARIAETAQGLCPVDTGRLRSSIRYEVDGRYRNFTVVVGTNVNYAAEVEYGTGPHVIRPKTKKALYWPGARHPVAKVNHPGTRPKPYMRPAIAAAPQIWRVEAQSIGRGRGRR